MEGRRWRRKLKGIINNNHYILRKCRPLTGAPVDPLMDLSSTLQQIVSLLWALQVELFKEVENPYLSNEPLKNPWRFFSKIEPSTKTGSKY